MTRLFAAAAVLATLAAAAPARAEVSLALAPSRELALSLALTAAEPAPAAKETTIFGLPKNMGTADRLIRAGIAAALVGIGSYRLANDSPNSTLSGVLLGVAAIPAATAATGYCPLYHPFGIDTN